MEAKMKDHGIEDLSPQGLLDQAIKTGSKSMIESAKNLVEISKVFERKRENSWKKTNILFSNSKQCKLKLCDMCILFKIYDLWRIMY